MIFTLSAIFLEIAKYTVKLYKHMSTRATPRPGTSHAECGKSDADNRWLCAFYGSARKCLILKNERQGHLSTTFAIVLLDDEFQHLQMSALRIFAALVVTIFEMLSFKIIVLESLDQPSRSTASALFPFNGKNQNL